MKRLGKFIATHDFMAGSSAPEVFSIMGFVPLRVESLGYNGTFECIGLCHLFNPLEDGFKVPEYRLEISEHEDPDIDELVVIAVAI